MPWDVVATVESDSRPGVLYDIKRAPDGRIGCTCPSYRFKRGEKTCKHLRAWNGVDAMVLSMPTPQSVTQTRVETTGLETFTFVRALDLEE